VTYYTGYNYNHYKKVQTFIPIVILTGIKNDFLYFYKSFVYALYHIQTLYIITQNIHTTDFIQSDIYMKYNVIFIWNTIQLQTKWLYI